MSDAVLKLLVAAAALCAAALIAHGPARVVFWAVVGAIIGWLANQIMTKGSLGMRTDIMIGAVAGMMGGLLFPGIGFGQPVAPVGDVINSALGAVIGTFVGRIVKRAQ
jgi:uncharacterized membrane protein YeaQ/YmgE (transglycosylase-associated protein family)